MAKKLISYDDHKPGTGLPDVVEEGLNTTYGTKAELSDLDAGKLGKAEARGTYSRFSDLPAPAKATVVIMWDDGYREVWDNLRPLLLARPHHKHAFAIFLDGVDGLHGPAPGFMNAEQVNTLANEGHEICAHAVTENPWIKDLPATDRAFEYDECKRGLEEIIGQPVTTWVYPNGTNSRSVLTDRELYLRYGRVMSNVGGVPFTQPGHTGHYVRRLLWNPQNHETAKSALRAAAENGMTVCLAAHKPGGANDLSMSQIEEVLDLVDDLGIRTILPREAYPSPAGRLINPGFEEGVAGWDIVTAGTGAGEVVDSLPEQGMSGTKALRLWSTGDPVAGDWAYANQVVPVTPGVTYTFAAAMKGNKTGMGGNPALRVAGQTWDPRVQTREVSGEQTRVAAEWQILQVDFTPNPDEIFARLDLRLPPMHGGEVFYDRVSFAPKAFGVFV